MSEDENLNPISPEGEYETSKPTGNIEATLTLLQEKMNTLKKELESQKASFVTLFGIFAAIFTFFSIEIKFLNEINNTSGFIGFSLIFVGMMLCFLMAIDFIVNRENEGANKTLRTIYLFCTIGALLFSGACILLLRF